MLNKIDSSQCNRFFFWHVKEFLIPQYEIEVHAANMHINPSNDYVKRLLVKVRAGQIVHIKGQLIEGRRPMAGIGVAR